MDTDLVEEIIVYYEKRNLKKPDVWQSLGWATTELGEVYEVLLSMEGGWVRNNPEDHQPKSKADLAYELGDVIMMLIVAGLAEGVNPLQALRNKIKRKMDGLAVGNSELQLVGEKEAEEFSEEK